MGMVTKVFITRLKMNLNLVVTLGAILASFSTPLMAQSTDDKSSEYEKYVSMFITLQGYSCVSVLSVEQREEPNAYDVICTDQENEQGNQLRYFFQLANGAAVVKPLDS